MRRILTSVLVASAASVLLLWGTAGSEGPDDSYLVRAVFDNGGFVVSGEEVRIAGATVGVVDSVDVSGNEEIVSLENGPEALPGKAIVVLRIDNEGFRDFRADASCVIRPQSLIGEKFVDCRPTEPRAPGSEPPPPLETISDGEPGAGQLLLPLENNGKTVDLDLVNNIMRRPYADRFRLIINDLGAGLAARGDELAEIVRRSSPALRETDRVLAILAAQNRTLAELATDSDTVLEPLARERARLVGFIDNAGATAAAVAERRDDLEAQLQRLPRFLDELRLTSRDLTSFSGQASPVVAQLGLAAPSLRRATVALDPFASAASFALRSLGAAAAEAGPDLRDADPILVDLRDLGRTAARPNTDLARLTGSLKRTEGFERLMDFIYNNSGSVNGFDQYGHYLRSNFLATNCVDVDATPILGCSSDFLGGENSARMPSARELLRQFRPAPVVADLTVPAPRRSGGTSAPGDDSGPLGLLEYLLGP